MEDIQEHGIFASVHRARARIKRERDFRSRASWIRAPCIRACMIWPLGIHRNHELHSSESFVQASLSDELSGRSESQLSAFATRHLHWIQRRIAVQRRGFPRFSSFLQNPVSKLSKPQISEKTGERESRKSPQKRNTTEASAFIPPLFEHRVAPTQRWRNYSRSLPSSISVITPVVEFLSLCARTSLWLHNWVKIVKEASGLLDEWRLQKCRSWNIWSFCHRWLRPSRATWIRRTARTMESIGWRNREIWYRAVQLATKHTGWTTRMRWQLKQ